MRQFARQTTGGLPTTFWYLWTGTLVNRLGAFVLPFLSIYLTTRRGLSVSAAGLVIGCYGVGAAVGTTAGGVLADRWGRRATLLTAHLGAATSMVTLGFASDRLVITGVALVLGVFTEGVRPAFSAMMVDVVPSEDRIRAFTLNYWAVNLGFACAAVLAGVAAEASYLLLFLVDAATTLVTATIVFTRVPETLGRVPRPAVATAGGPVVTPSALRTILGDRVFLVLVALNLPIGFVFMQHISALPIAMGHDGISPGRYGMVIAMNGVMIVAGQLFVPKLVAGRDMSRVLAVAAVLVGIGFGLNAVANTVPMYLTTVVIWTAGEMLNSPAGTTLLAELSPADMRGRYQGLVSLSWSAASTLAPVLGGAVQQHLGDPALWLACAFLALFTAAAQLVAAPARSRRIAALRAREHPPVPVASAGRRTPGSSGSRLRSDAADRPSV